MPVLVAAIGRRLGYPIRLATTKEHCFVRWEEPGIRFNIEPTTEGVSTPTDDYYRSWPVPHTADEARRYGFLKTCTFTEEMAHFMCDRGHCWQENQRFGPALEAHAWAASLVPDQEGFRNAVMRTVIRWNNHLDPEVPPNFPNIRFEYSVEDRWYPRLPLELEKEIVQIHAMDALVHTVREPHRTWWKLLRESPQNRPKHVPSTICFDTPGKNIAWHLGVIP